MIKKNKYNFFSLLILINICLTTFLYANVEIIAIVDNEVITNYDIKKEKNYLKILNPKLKNLSEKQLSKLAKDSLIKEVIKKKTVSKLVSLEEKNSFTDTFYKNLIKRLGYENENSFEENILSIKTYSSDEIKLKIKIELFWNDLIFNNYNNQTEIDEKKVISNYKNNKKEKTKEIFISEIVFRRIKNEKIENTIYKIKKSIEEIGFENTANLFSIADSSKYGGKIGWIATNGLPEKIYNNIINIEPNELSDVININDNFIIYKVNEIRFSKNNVDDNEEIQRIIENKKNQRLEQFSRIYYNKIKSQFLIYEK